MADKKKDKPKSSSENSSKKELGRPKPMTPKAGVKKGRY